MKDNSDGSGDCQHDGINDAVRHMDKFHAEGSDRLYLAGPNGNQLGFFLQAVLSKFGFDQFKGKSCPIDGDMDECREDKG